MLWEYGMKCRVSSGAAQRSQHCCSPPLTCTDLSASPTSHFLVNEISQHPQCTSISPGAVRSTWEYSCLLWEHFAQLQVGLEASGITVKQWYGQLECTGGLHVAPWPNHLWLMLLPEFAGHLQSYWVDTAFQHCQSLSTFNGNWIEEFVVR